MRQIRKATGFALLTAGVLGMVLPVVPGLPLLIAGLALLRASDAMPRWVVRFEDYWNLLRSKRP